METELHLAELTEKIRKLLLYNISYDKIGEEIADEYIELVESVEGKTVKDFDQTVIKKYPDLLQMCEVRNKAFLAGICDMPRHI